MQAAIKLLGLSTPLVYASAVVWLFWWLDRKAAPQARRTVTDWFSGPTYNKTDVSRVIVEVFDLLYTRPLWGWRAILRSALFSTILTVIVSFQLFPATYQAIWFAPDLSIALVRQFFQNIASDYFSLFFIRQWLFLAGKRPLFALVTAPVIGAIIVALCYVLIDVGAFSILVREFHWRYFREDFWNWYGFIRNHTMRWSFLAPAFVVHLWLPLFAFGVLMAQFMNSIRLAGRFSQWFFLQGKAHPLRSIGYIAGAATFVVASATKLI